MAIYRAIVVKRIARMTGVLGIPRALSNETIRRLVPGESVAKVRAQVLTAVKKQTKRDGNDRQIELQEVIVPTKGPRRISSKVLLRVYRASDKSVRVYKGPAKQGPRD